MDANQTVMPRVTRNVYTTTSSRNRLDKMHNSAANWSSSTRFCIRIAAVVCKGQRAATAALRRLVAPCWTHATQKIPNTKTLSKYSKRYFAGRYLQHLASDYCNTIWAAVTPVSAILRDLLCVNFIIFRLLKLFPSSESLKWDNIPLLYTCWLYAKIRYRTGMMLVSTYVLRESQSACNVVLKQYESVQ